MGMEAFPGRMGFENLEEWFFPAGRFFGRIGGRMG
jgi:hypothetical protein